MSLEQQFIEEKFATIVLNELDDINVGTESLSEFLPENEIYGRSLSTIRKLGEYMLSGNNHNEVIVSPEAQQARVEFRTSVEEGFGTDMELGGGLEVRDFDIRPVIDGRVMAKDLKTPVSEMTESGLRCADSTLEKDSRFLPQHIRSGWDHKNALLVDSMAQGETGYNTRIIVSPFPEEAAAEFGDKYWRDMGYVPHLKRGFVQMYHMTEDGHLLSGSLSFDGSDKIRLRKIFTRYGVDVPESEVTDDWLQHAITDTLSERDARSLATEIADLAGGQEYNKVTNTVDVTGKYESLMDKVFDESYIHICESLASGKQTDELRDLVLQLSSSSADFSSRYASSLDEMRVSENSFTADDSIVLHELLVYSTIEMMRSLHLDNEMLSVGHGKSAYTTPRQFNQVDPVVFQNMLGNFVAEGARNNRTYSACGLSISAGNERNGLQDITSDIQRVFGGVLENGKDDVDESWVWKKGVCRVEACSTRPGMTETGPFDVCRNCQHEFDSGRDPTKKTVPRSKEVLEYEKRQESIDDLIKATFGAIKIDEKHKFTV